MDSQVVSITSQGQLTIPKFIREDLGIVGATKAVIEKTGGLIVVKPKKDFWSIAGALKSSVKLSDKELKEARKSFERDWANHD
ncbi:AbrB/MazE/SpoVT family DNA-binding domain-containing protein [candidate division WWE3 bacterium CG_4_10_14_0_2_um_filter_42_7]|uniref:AbrB/MazE/SpoVT family DNA-binding domain-containing protein n=2 Tax=Katanobacteria TaxID=422282 RepID=A0A2H0X8Z5_UNCKA|nr:MAG: AbrB/MazE/SpoVT family DNA-binding domain-containing protein [candidate division WWE3 bacterium CG08_land_8_20_14_0_20_41_15]PIZ43600.1 MAG: AbrB/MazE/SpoVT family DNA-binding domain-containing protein [candidate division WWE3 bacterium CG_4_10_14_0_2_um_filter_42_7]